MKFKLFVAASALVISSGLSFAAPINFAVDPSQSPAEFLATGKPGFLKIHGEGAKVSGSGVIDGNKLTGSFKLALDGFKTGIDLRDTHMKEKYLEVGKFPEAILTLDPMDIAWPAETSSKAFTGKLTIKGVEKAVQGTLSLKKDGEKAVGNAEFTVKLADYPIGVPSHLGITVAEVVNVTVKISADQKSTVAAAP